MQRRRFLATSLAASAAALTTNASVAEVPATRLFFELRRYSLITGPQMAKLTEAYLAEALLPALNRLGMRPIGAFRLEYGPETPAITLLLPHASLDTLVNAAAKLGHDDEYLKASQAFRTVTAERPAFHRIDSELLQAFPGFPTLRLPAAGKGKRIFQLRTYESPTPQTHERKIEMFEHGEYEIFRAVGCEAVFFGETLIGTRMPSLTYMLAFNDLADLTAKWDLFRVDPAWKKLSSSERYSSEALVSNITNLVLSPTTYSQI